MKIGFYGDSFCEEISNPYSLFMGYDTYISKLKKHFSADIINLGKGGTSFWDVILNQFNTDNVPDICIFCWTNYNRLYHPVVKNLTYNSVTNLKIKDIKLTNITHYPTIKAGQAYFKHIHDPKKSKEEMISALYRFDREVLENLQGTKILHMWCFENIYHWKNGTVLPIVLSDLVGDGSQHAPNHLDGSVRNANLASMILDSINAM